MGGLWKISYRYDNPHGAGPFKGSTTVPAKYTKGDTYYAPFGRATVVSCRTVAPRTDLKL